MSTPAQSADKARKQLRSDYLLLALGLIGTIVCFYAFGSAAALCAAGLTAVYYFLVARKSARSFLRGCWAMQLGRLTGQSGSLRLLRGQQVPALQTVRQRMELPGSPAQGIIRQAMTFTGDSLILTALDLNYPVPLADKTLATVSGCCLRLESDAFPGPGRIYRSTKAFPYQAAPEGYAPFSEDYLVKGQPQPGDAALLEALKTAHSPTAVLELGDGYAALFLAGKLLGSYRPGLKISITESTEDLRFLPELPILCGYIS